MRSKTTGYYAAFFAAVVAFTAVLMVLAALLSWQAVLSLQQEAEAVAFFEQHPLPSSLPSCAIAPAPTKANRATANANFFMFSLVEMVCFTV